MKLSATTAAFIKSLDQPIETNLTTSMVDVALAYAADGWNVFPLGHRSKFPLIKRAHPDGDPLKGKCKGECGRDGHGAHDGTRDPDKIKRWWTKSPQAGIGANLGETRLAFDIDFNKGGHRLDAFPDTRTHLSGRGNGNCHLVYAIEPGTAASTIRPGVGKQSFTTGIDIRVGRGSYIVLPPSLHEETGNPYTADKIPEHTLTDDEVEAIYLEAGVDRSASVRAATKGISLVGGGSGNRGGRSLLNDLLADPPGEGERNDWLARVAGHYAKQYRTQQDLFETHMAAANAMLTPPLEEDEYRKTVDSIWSTEASGHPEREASIDNGWLVGNRRILFCQIQTMVGDTRVMDLAPWGDFDIEALGVAVDEVDNRMYWVRLYWRDRVMDATLDAATLGDDRAIRKWLATRGPSFDPPYQAVPKTNPGVRLSRYLESQSPPQVKIVETLGWHQEIKKFVTHDGAITRKGRIDKESAGVVADPRLIERDVAPYSYGFSGDWAEAQRVLREVLTFQDSTVTSVFGAWWAACLLRPQIQERTSLFPFFGVEATSESGKTNGFFDMMVALNGNTRGQIAPTRPVLRDYASANKNGIVWADDLDSLEVYGELLRASTSNGTASKMDIDRSGIKNTEIVSPILVTGEALGMNSQKALIDRSVVLNVPSPKGRMSTRGDYYQWDDILDLQGEYPKHDGGLSALAGWFVEAALGVVPETMQALKRAKRLGSGRHGDKLAVLRAGAALLDYLVGHDGAWDGEGEHSRRIEEWATKGEGSTWLDKDNALTAKVLPWALATFPGSKPVENTMGRFQGIDSPVFTRANSRSANDEEGTLLGSDLPKKEIWYNPQLLFEAWRRDHAGRIDLRTETKDALQQQSNALARDRGKAVTIAGTGRRGWYRRLPDEYVDLVLRRSQGR